jgi:hypothetical protein
MGEEETGGPLAISSVFFEFIPETRISEVDPPTLGVDEIEDGKRYYVVVTNSAGLYRYLIGDLVEVCGFYFKTPRIRFVRKLGATSNLVGELIEEIHVSRSVGVALEDRGLEATWFALVADATGELPGYNLYLELSHDSMGSERLRGFSEQVDAVLSSLTDYGSVRKDGQLRSLRLLPVAKGTYDTWRRNQVAQGAGEAQLKPPQLFGEATALPDEFRRGIH